MPRKTAVLFLLAFLAVKAPAATRSSASAADSHPITAIELFNPEAARSALPELEIFRQWMDTDAGGRLAQKLVDEEDQKWLALFLNIDPKKPEEGQLAVISPVIQEFERSKAKHEQLKATIRELASAEPKEQEKLFKAVIKTFKAARKEAAPKVAQALKEAKKAFDGRLKQENADTAALSREATQLHELVRPITYMYGSAKAHLSKIADFSKTLTTARFLDAREKVELLSKGNLKTNAAAWDKVAEFDPTAGDATWIQAKPRPEGEPESEPAAVSKPFGIGLARPPVGPEIIIPSHADMLEFGGKTTRRVLSPIQADGKVNDIPELLEAGNLAAEEAIISMYEEGLDQDVDSIIKAVKGGARFTIIADYSNLFPKGGRDRSPQYDKLVEFFLSQKPSAKNWDGLGLKLHVLKGYGSIGINHNKFRAWKLKDGRWILQQGSFNYTLTSQKNHWENVAFIDDPVAVALFQSYFRWKLKGARPFKEGLKPEEPKILQPITRDTTLAGRFNGEPFPLVSFSPNGDAEDFEVKALEKSVKDFMYVIFGFYPTPNVMAAIIQFLDKKDANFRLLADYGQSHNPASIAAMSKILQLRPGSVRLISGPNETPWRNGQRHNAHEKNHNKIVKGDRSLVGSGSTNDSKNAFFKNFENRMWFLSNSPIYAVYAAMLDEITEALWELGFEPDFSGFNTASFEPGIEAGAQ